MDLLKHNIKVLIADDHSFTRIGLRRFLESEGFDISEAGNFQDAQNIFEITIPDVVILDIEMPEKRGGPTSYGNNAGLRLARYIKEKRPKVGIVLLSSHPDRGRYFWDMVSQGHRGMAYLLKDGDPLRLLDAIIQTQAHRVICDEQVTQNSQTGNELVKRLSLDEQSWVIEAVKQMETLTRREKEVVDALQESHDIKGIAIKLGTKENAISNHITNIYEKLGLNQVPKSLSSRTLLIKASLIYQLQEENRNV